MQLEKIPLSSQFIHVRCDCLLNRKIQLLHWYQVFHGQLSSVLVSLLVLHILTNLLLQCLIRDKQTSTYICRYYTYAIATLKIFKRSKILVKVLVQGLSCFRTRLLQLRNENE